MPRFSARLIPLPARRLANAWLVMAVAWCVPALAADYTLVVHSGYPERAAKAAYAPLVDHLSQVAGVDIRLRVPSSVLAHWHAMADPDGYDLVLDEGHFTDYRVKRFGYVVLAKVAGLSGFSVVSGPETVLVEPEELYGEPVASLAPPSLAALRLAELFPDPIRAPLLVEVDSYRQGIRRVVNGEVAAAVILSAMVNEFPELNVVVSTQQGPGLALSASPRVPSQTRDAIRVAVLALGASESGRRALARARLGGFEPASAALYDGYARLLRGTWGY